MTLQVRTPQGSYDVHVADGLLNHARDLIPHVASYERICVVADVAVRASADLLAEQLGATLVHVVPSGEASKSLGEASKLWGRLAEGGFHRNDLIVAAGGGVTGDLAGFVAATFHRGMPWVVVPTTLLAMVDSSIGGKTAIDIPQGKNLVGAFHQPASVISDVAFLRQLPEHALATGMAEVVKHGLIADQVLLDDRMLDKVRADDPLAVADVVTRAAKVKVDVVNADVSERGARAHLNYGHTLGHALEALGGYSRWTHGEAISIGMMFAAHLAPALGYKDRVDEHREALASQGLPTSGAPFDFGDVMAMFARDKKYDRGLRFVVLRDLGDPIVRDVPEDALRAAYEKVR